ncbi:LuxR C-terminal-related transcriptional regulator [Actinokineospora sp. 24-640]
MGTTVIAVCSADKLMLPGIAHLFRDDPRMSVVAEEKANEADVLMVVSDTGDTAALGRAARLSAAPIVLVADRVDVADLARHRVAWVVARRAATPAALATAVIAAVIPGAEDGPPARVAEDDAVTLSPRERELLHMLADGYDTAEIARGLRYSERTVKNIVRGLLNRLGLRNRAHVVAYAIREGVL